MNLKLMLLLECLNIFSSIASFVYHRSQGLEFRSQVQEWTQE